MWRVAECLKKIKNSLAGMSLMTKLTLAYMVAILVPTVVIGSYTYRRSTEYTKYEMVQSSRHTLLQIKDNISKKIAIAQGMANNIAYNKKIQNLLYYGMDFTAETLFDYTGSIAFPVEYALDFTEASIYQISVYFTNPSIIESHRFFSEQRVKDLDWYRDFVNSTENDRWIYPFGSDRFYFNGINGSTRVFRLVKKIKAIDGSFLGVIAMDILEDEMLSPVKFDVAKGEKIFAVNEKNRIIFPPVSAGELLGTEILNEKINQGNGHFFYQDLLYCYENMDPLNIKLVLQTSVKDMLNNTSKLSKQLIFAVILGTVVLEVFTYFVLKVIFSRLNQIVKIMNAVAKGNFNIRIPVVHRDEVGQLANDFNILIQKINELINDLIKKETAQKDAQLAALQYRINPHFIYNTIDTFRMKLELEGNYEMAEAITYFGKMLRYSISLNSKYVTIGEEADYIGKYINLQKIRYGERLKCMINLPQTLSSAKILRFMLQPVVENSIKHGMKDGNEPLVIRIEFEIEGDCLVIQVIDNGRGISAGQLDRLNYRFKYSNYISEDDSAEKSIGLDNINNRIKLFYGEQYHIRIDSIPDEYTKTIISVPYISG